MQQLPEEFLFTLKNPHNTLARKFAFKAERKQSATWCHSFYGPVLAAALRSETGVSSDTRNETHLGRTSTSDTGLDGQTFFIGSRNFQVMEIEVTDEITLPNNLVSLDLSPIGFQSLHVRREYSSEQDALTG
jgi:hypothetical protein